MLVFCPHCSNVLEVARANPSVTFPKGQNSMICRACPYVSPINRPLYEKTELKRKEVEDIIGGKDEWKNADRTDAQCPAENCEGTQAYFYQVQIRSADEPMTTFYRCTNCAKRWKEN